MPEPKKQRQIRVVELGGRCPRGEIFRDPYSYTREGENVKVKGKCITNQGTPGKTPASDKVLPKLKAGKLFGWKADLPAAERRKSLKKATSVEGCRAVIFRINALRGYTKNTSPPTYNKLVADWKWLRKQGFCELKSKENGKG